MVYCEKTILRWVVIHAQKNIFLRYFVTKESDTFILIRPGHDVKLPVAVEV